MIRACAAIATLALASSAVAQQVDPPTPTVAEQRVLPLLKEAETTTDPKQMLALIDQALGQLLQPTPFRGSVLCIRAAALIRLDRTKEAADSIRNCELLRPTDPVAALFGAATATQNRDGVAAAHAITRGVKANPLLVQMLDPDMMRSIVRQLNYINADHVRDEMVTTLAEAGFAKWQPLTFSPLAFDVVKDKVAAGDTKGAVGLLPDIVSPQSGLQMLVDRRFASIWPALESWAGGDLLLQRDAMISQARAGDAADTSLERRIELARVLAESGQPDEAIGMLRAILADPTTLKTDPYEYGMAGVALGRTLAAAARLPAAIEAMQSAVANAHGEEGAIALIAPNLALRHLDAGDRLGAKQTLDRYPVDVKGMESPAAQGYFVALRSCALTGGATEAEAAKLAATVRADYAANVDAVQILLDCRGTPDELADFWKRKLDDPDRRADALIDFATAQARMASGLPISSGHERGMRLILDRADVRSAYDAKGRLLAPSYTPALLDWEFGSLPPRSKPAQTTKT